MGLWPGEEHFKHCYDMVTEYVTIMKELWEKGQSDFKGKLFTMNDCRLGPLPSHPIRLISAGTSDADGGSLEDRARRVYVWNTRPKNLEYYTEKWNEFLAA